MSNPPEKVIQSIKKSDLMVDPIYIEPYIFTSSHADMCMCMNFDPCNNFCPEMFCLSEIFIMANIRTTWKTQNIKAIS